MEPACRFCLDSQNAADNPLRSPCECKGSSQYVHRDCLQQWRNTTVVDKYRRVCQLCHAPFEAEYRWPVEPFSVGSAILTYEYSSSMLFLWLLQYGLSVYVTLVMYIYAFAVKGEYTTGIESQSHVIGLFAMTTIVLLNCIHLFSRTINKGRYLLYMLTNRTSRDAHFRTPYTIVFFAAGSFLLYTWYAPVGVMCYCLTLSKLAPIHRGVLMRLNEDGIFPLE
jgi:hypothetical protein